jgi:hypothetical protein
VELGHKVLWEYCAQSKHSMSYDALGTADQAAMHQAAEDRYLAYILLVNSGGQHDHLRKELQKDFTKGSNKYPENCSQTLLFLDRYSKSAPVDSGLQGTAFAHKGGQPKKGKEKKGSDKPKAEKRTLIRSTSRIYLASSAGRRVIHNRTAQQKPMMMTIHPSPADQVGAASQAGSQKSRISRINSRT